MVNIKNIKKVNTIQVSTGGVGIIYDSPTAQVKTVNIKFVIIN